MLNHCESRVEECVSPATLAPFTKFCLLLSALGHDADHPGNTNSFEVANRTEIGIVIPYFIPYCQKQNLMFVGFIFSIFNT